jgi:hypothetical protein
MPTDRFRELIGRLRDFGDFYDPDEDNYYDGLDEWLDADAPIDDEEDEDDSE